MTYWKTLTFAGKALASLAALAMIVALLTFGPAACNRYLAEKKAGQIERGQHKATLDSMDVAASTAAEIDRAEHDITAETKEAADEVRSAPAGDSNDAADRAACKLRAYRNSERCAALRSADTPDAP